MATSSGRVSAQEPGRCVRGGGLMRPPFALVPATDLHQERGQRDREHEHPVAVVATSDPPGREQPTCRPAKTRRQGPVVEAGSTDRPPGPLAQLRCLALPRGRPRETGDRYQHITRSVRDRRRILIQACGARPVEPRSCAVYRAGRSHPRRTLGHRYRSALPAPLQRGQRQVRCQPAAATRPLVRSTLAAARNHESADLVVDLTEITFCSIRGFEELIACAATGYTVTGTAPHLDRLAALFGSDKPEHTGVPDIARLTTRRPRSL